MPSISKIPENYFPEFPQLRWKFEPGFDPDRKAFKDARAVYRMPTWFMSVRTDNTTHKIILIVQNIQAKAFRSQYEVKLSGYWRESNFKKNIVFLDTNSEMPDVLGLSIIKLNEEYQFHFVHIQSDRFEISATSENIDTDDFIASNFTSLLRVVGDVTGNTVHVFEEWEQSETIFLYEPSEDVIYSSFG